jgi:hypothetical protein
VGVVDGVEAGEWFGECVAGDGLVVDVELDEDDLVEQAALFVVAAPVQRVCPNLGDPETPKI